MVKFWNNIIHFESASEDDKCSVLSVIKIAERIFKQVKVVQCKELLSSFRYVLFDKDGTLENNTEQCLKLNQEWQVSNNLNLFKTTQDMAFSFMKAFKYGLTQNEKRDINEICTHLNKRKNRCDLFEDVESVIKWYSTMSRLGILSSNTKEGIMQFLKDKDIIDIFDQQIIFAGDKQLNLKNLLRTCTPRDILVVGDNLSDIAESNKVNASSVLVLLESVEERLFTILDPFIAESSKWGYPDRKGGDWFEDDSFIPNLIISNYTSYKEYLAGSLKPILVQDYFIGLIKEVNYSVNVNSNIKNRVTELVSQLEYS
ncbi:hypothetical protein DID75_01160 [Candidatus Marinamargulisbacteria bacterium SCGC AG-410-N11]|nr:hypothetical protein DID75_01160 [Candidatus Marinamargulisbacteria bacterium SCGC AG-410-N11]